MQLCSSNNLVVLASFKATRARDLVGDFSTGYFWSPLGLRSAQGPTVLSGRLRNRMNHPATRHPPSTKGLLADLGLRTVFRSRKLGDRRSIIHLGPATCGGCLNSTSIRSVNKGLRWHTKFSGSGSFVEIVFENLLAHRCLWQHRVSVANHHCNFLSVPRCCRSWLADRQIIDASFQQLAGERLRDAYFYSLLRTQFNFSE